MRHNTTGPGLRRRTVPILAAILTVGVTTGVLAQEGDAQASTYEVELFLVEDEVSGDTSLQRIRELWPLEGREERLKALLNVERVRRLESVTVIPGGETPAFGMGGVIVRVNGGYRGPDRDRMFLRVEVDGGREAFVKEMISRFDETIVVVYRVDDEDRSLVAVVGPVPNSS